MRKIKFILAALVFLFFAAVAANAQNKVVETDSWDFEGFMDCTDDYVTGVETMVVTHWDTKYQARYKGDYEGVSGKHYTWSLVVNNNYKNWVPGETFTRTYVSNSTIECEGEPIAIYKIRYHVTVTADGNVVVERYWDSGDGWICL